jgi:hypothetical protein
MPTLHKQFAGFKLLTSQGEGRTASCRESACFMLSIAVCVRVYVHVCVSVAGTPCD